MKLYIYEHCPFCARVRYVAGILGIDLDINVLEYHDENTPTSLIGKKSVPILLKGNKATTESMEIITDFFQLTQTFDAKQVSQAVLDWQKAAFPLLQQIGYPRWANLPLQEFKSELSRTEWKRKKESDTLNFSELLENISVIVKTVNTLIEEAVQLLNFQNGNPTLSLVDQAIIFSILRGFYTEPSIHWGEELDNWLRTQSLVTKIPLLA